MRQPSPLRFALAPVLVATLGGGALGQSTERVSVDSAGNQGDQGTWGSIPTSADGRFVAFASWADNLIVGDGNWKMDIFVRDRLLGTTERVSVNTAGVEGNGSSFWPAISADGRIVAFESEASNLVQGDTNHVNDVFVHDRQTGVTERVSVDSSGAEANLESLYPALSSDGVFVAFHSQAYNLVASDTNNCRDTFVRDRNAGTTERVSVDSSGAEGNRNSYYFSAISADGRFVAFASDATNLVAGDTNSARDVFVRDRQSGTTERVSVDSAGKQAMYAPSDDPSISADGRFVAFDSLGGFDANDTNIYYDVYVRDRQNGKTKVVSVDANGKAGNGVSGWPSISAHGRYVVFTSDADDLVPGDNNGFNDVFLRDRVAGTTKRASVDSSGGEGDWHSATASVSSDGRFVAFISEASNLVAGDTNNVIDAFVHGPWLTLEADPAAPPAGATLSFTTWTGMSSGASLLAATAVNGAPTFVPVVLGTFDSAGRWNWSGTVPAGLSGIVASFTAFGFVPSGKVDASNEVDVTFQ